MAETTSATSVIRGLLDVDPFRRYRDESVRTRAKLDELLSKEIPSYASEDTSLVVFGSLARGEWTVGSDLDWTYLIDGQANSDHLKISQEIRKAFLKAKLQEPQRLKPLRFRFRFGMT
jgi:predicted nucleotidyltransferase